ncbi:MAG: GspH/FimT family pseudopilin [Pseudoalteromonas distincta]
MKSVKGFTLIELMVTLAVAAILIFIAVPSFQRVSASNSLTNTAQDLIATINTARMQSMSTRSDILVSPGAGGWADGWTLVYPPTASETSVDFVPRRDIAITRDDGAGELRFMARGGLQGGEAVFSVCHEDDNVSGREIRVSFLGKITTELKDCSA